MPSYEQLVKEAARKYNLPPDYLHKLIQYESRGDPNAVSSTGATGLAQFTRGTAKQYGLRDRTDPAASIDAAARLAVDNRNAIKKSLGREPTSSELYLGHLQGAGTAGKGFSNPNAKAVDVFGRQAVSVNLPKSQRGNLDTITAKQFQDLHQANFNRTKSGTVDIGTEPQLATLNPPKKQSTAPIEGPINFHLKQILGQKETDSNTMARHKYPGYNEAIRQSLTGNTENVEAAPSSFIPPDTDLKGRVKLAGVTLPNIRPPGNKGRYAVDPRADEVKRDRLPKPEDVPGARTPTVEQETENARKQAERQQELQTKKARVQRGDDPTLPAKSGPPIAAPPPPPGTVPPAANVNTPIPVANTAAQANRILNPKNAAGAAGVGAAASAIGAANIPGAADPNDSALMQVYQYLRGKTGSDDSPSVLQKMISGGRPGGPVVDDSASGSAGGKILDYVTGKTGRIVGEGPGTPAIKAAGAPRSSVDSSTNVSPETSVALQILSQNGVLKPNAQAQVQQLLHKAAPAFRDILADPDAQKVAQKVISKQAARDAAGADMQRDPTYYQRMAAMQDPSAPGAEQAMMRAVSRDQNNSMRGPSPRGVVPGQAPQQLPIPPQAQQPPVTTSATEQIPLPRPRPPEAPTTEQQILQQAMGPNAGSQAQRFPPSGPPAPPAYRQGSMRPLQMSGQGGEVFPQQAMNPATVNSQMFDPSQAQLWKFFGGEGGGM